MRIQKEFYPNNEATNTKGTPHVIREPNCVYNTQQNSNKSAISSTRNHF